MGKRSVVRAAGAVVWRPSTSAGGGAGEAEVVVVHRPAPHDDWSLPKGKLDPGERHRDAAVREVHEETAVRGELGPRLGEVRYALADGTEKRVRWWSLRALHDDGFVPGDEIDERRWLPVSEAVALLSWPSDVQVLGWFRERGSEPTSDGEHRPR